MDGLNFDHSSQNSEGENKNANPEKISHYLYGRLQGTSRFVRPQLRSAVKTFVFSSSILLHLGIFFP